MLNAFDSQMKRIKFDIYFNALIGSAVAGGIILVWVIIALSKSKKGGEN